ncbi:MAG: N-6 DNA methylase [Rhodopirellula sp.]|nr:N-6 DNA methylase [Rhodopirellula sp.]
MQETVAKLFQRFVEKLPAGPDATLRAEKVQIADETSATPWHTVLIHGRHDGSDAPLAVVLVTVPSRAADDNALLEFVVRRARAHKAPYFVTWTLRDAILWRTPKAGTPAARDAMEKLKDYPDLYEIGQADQGPLDERTKLKVLDRGGEILHDLECLLKDEALELVQIDATYFVNRLLDAVQHLLPMVSHSIHDRLGGDIAFRDELTAWAVKQAIAGDPADPEFAESIARQIIYRLLGKMLFYQSLRRSARHLPKLDFDGVDTAQVLPKLRIAFAEARKIDYHAVFDEALPDRIQWPAEASRALADLIHDFHTRDFAALPQDVVGTVFERLIPPEERHGLGQYFTSENLCDLLNAFCITAPTDKVLDPTCGTGTFLIRAYDRLRWLGQHDHVTLLSQLWGVDIAPFPAELATINLFRQKIAEYGNFPRILCHDFLRIDPGDKFRFPPPKMDLERPEEMEEPIPQFDAIVGNFPYVSADQIEKHEAGYLEFLRKRLIADWFDEYPEVFYYPTKKEQTEFEKFIAKGQHRGCDRKNVQHRISTYADLYVHLFFHTARFLRPGGRMGIVTSNAWLDVNYGYELQKFFLKHFKIVAILESRCEPWFTEASVNTIVTIIERCDDPKERDNHLAKFVKVKKPLAELIPGDPVVDAVPRLTRLRDLVAQVEQAGRKYGKTHPLGMVTEEDDNFRIRILRQSEMLAEVEREEKTVKWGRYLRAPQVYFDVLEHGKMCRLGDMAVPLRGGMTRINEFFYVTPDTVREHGIEDEYLLPLIKSPKDTATIRVDLSELDLRVFVCRRSKAELKRLGHRGALRYIEWGEDQTWKDGSLWKDGVWVKDRKPGWWALPPSETHLAQVFLSKGADQRHIHRFSPESLIADQRLYYLNPAEGMSPSLLAAVLNASITALGVELTVPLTAGDGVCELRVEDAREYLPVPDVRVSTKAVRGRVERLLEPLLERAIEAVPVELKKADRQAFDAAILKAVGLDPKKYLKPIYEGLCELVRERIELGQMRGKARKTKARGTKAEKKAVEEVLDEVLPEGPRRFPEEFFSGAAAGGSKTAVDLPEAPLIFDSSPLFTGVHTADGSFSRNVKTPAEGKFLLYAQRSGHRTAELPDQTVEVTRTVANYEKYLRELRKQLYDAYYRRTLDTRTAARLTQSALDRFHLPSVEG